MRERVRLQPLNKDPGGAVAKNLPVNAGDTRDAGLIPGLGRFPGVENGNPLRCLCLENPRDGGARWAAVSGVAQGQTRLKRFSSSSSSILFPIVAAPIYIPTNSVGGFPFLHTLSSIYYL